MALTYTVRTLHKWMGLAVFLQLLFWIVGGVIMSSFPLSRVHGDHSRQTIEQEPLNYSSIYPLERIIPFVPRPIETVTLRSGNRGLVYAVKIQEWRSVYYDAASGRPLADLEREAVLDIARRNYRGTGSIASADLIREAGIEYRGLTPVWRVEFDDWESTTFYIAPDSGDITASRNTMWRIFDFVWMLHIMDYEGRQNFNNPLLISFAVTSLIFLLTGLWLLFNVQYRRDILGFLSFFSTRKVD